MLETGIYKRVNLREFIQSFKDKGVDCFSNSALDGLFDYYSQISEETGEPYILDPVDIGCNWTEYDDYQKVIDDYEDIDYSLQNVDDDEKPDQVLKVIQEHSDAFRLAGGIFLIKNF